MQGKIQCVLVWIGVLWCSSALWAQRTSVKYGKNRVQYETPSGWEQYKTDNFVVYWQQGQQTLGRYVVEHVEQEYLAVQQVMEYKIYQPLRVVVYPSMEAYRQTNITEKSYWEWVNPVNKAARQTVVNAMWGGTANEVNTDVGPSKNFFDNKIVVYFDGDHNHLDRQLREGIAKVLLHHLAVGGNLQEMVQNAVLLNLPKWFTEGLVAYVGEAWSTDMDNLLREAVLSGRYKGFGELAADNPRLAGHSLWHYIDNTSGRATVPNLLYVTRINRSVEGGLMYVLGNSLGQLSANWTDYYTQRYRGDKMTALMRDTTQRVPANRWNELPIRALKLSPTGDKLGWVAYNGGRVHVLVQDIASGAVTELMHYGRVSSFAQLDVQQPLLAWQPTSGVLAVVYTKGTQKLLAVFGTDYKQQGRAVPIAEGLENITSMSFGDNNHTLWLTGYKDGITDIYQVDISSAGRLVNLSNSAQDERQVSFATLGGVRGVLYSASVALPDSIQQKQSNRNFDIFFMPLDRSKSIVQITHTPTVDEQYPVAIDGKYYAYIADENGIANRFVGNIQDVTTGYTQHVRLHNGSYLQFPADSIQNMPEARLVDSTWQTPIVQPTAYNYIHTNYALNISEQHTADDYTVADLVYENDRFHVYLSRVDVNWQEKTSPTYYRKALSQTIPILPISTQTISNIQLGQHDSTATKPAPNYYFQTDFDHNDTPPQLPEAILAPTDSSGIVTIQKPEFEVTPIVKTIFSPANVYAYTPQYRTSFITIALDNNLLFDGLDQYSSKGAFNTPPPSILLQANLTDVFENYHFSGGVRIPTTFNGLESFLSFADNKHRLDKEFGFYRRTITDDTTSNVGINYENQLRIVNYGYAQLSYPLHTFSRLQATLWSRNDRTYPLASDLPSFNHPIFVAQRTGIKLEYILDNTFQIALNLPQGFRFKSWVEPLVRTNLNQYSNAAPQWLAGFSFNAGFDLRYYRPLDQRTVVALRATAGTSQGNERTLYYLGSVDNWLFRNFNNAIPVPTQDPNYAYQTLVAPLRGFTYNIRNGNSFALLNAELRVPIIRYLSSHVASSFLRNFQVVGFFDTGTAWEGASPFGKENPLNTDIIANPLSPVSVQVNYFRNPIVLGYGVGIRSTLFGYFVKADYARGIETDISNEGRWHLSIGYDF
jgi:hypothetical protein